jgi:hypothetical protein
MRTAKWKKINEYYRSPRGQRQLRNYINFQIFWHSSALPPHLSKYEEMKHSPEEAMKKIFNFLDREISDDEIKRIATLTSFENISNTGENSFYRKGIVGDWQNYLDDEIIQDIRLRCNTSGYSKLFLEYFFGW